MLFPGPDSAILHLDPALGLTDGGLWRDGSKYGLHVTPNANYAAPNYGLAIGPSGAPYIGFNGVNQNGSLVAPANTRFFSVAPTTQATVVVVARHNDPTATDNIFSSENAGATRGFIVSMNTAARMQVFGWDAAGALTFYPLDGNDTPYAARTRVTIISGRCTDALALRWIDGVGRTASYAIAATVGPIAYDAAVVPTVGCRTDGIRRFDGSLYFLGIWPLVFTDQEARACSAFWLDRV